MTLRKKLFWVSLLYFAQGMPFGVVLDVLPVYFRQNNVSLTEIGMMGALTLPWTIKVFWSPLLDRFGERRIWVTICCFAMALAMFCVPLFDAGRPGAILWILLIAFTVSSATQDIAIDAFSVGIAAKGEEGTINSLRAGLYRLGVLAGGGATMYLVAPFGWTWVFLALAWPSWRWPSRRSPRPASRSCTSGHASGPRGSWRSSAAPVRSPSSPSSSFTGWITSRSAR